MTINYSALKYNAQILDKFKEVFNPFFEDSCIKSFRYFRIFENNSYMNISTNHEWLVERLTKIPNNGKSFHKPLCEAVENKRSFFLWDDDKTDKVVNLFIKYNIFNGITAYRRNGKSVEAWSFGATVDSPLASNFYINNLEFLESFIEYFNKAAKEIIDPSDGSKLAFFNEKVSIISPSEEEKVTTINQCQAQIKRKDLILTAREIECLKLLSIGKTYKETARIMKISPRTVESYLILIKHKLGLNCKSKVVEYFWENLFDYRNN